MNGRKGIGSKGSSMPSHNVEEGAMNRMLSRIAIVLLCGIAGCEGGGAGSPDALGGDSPGSKVQGSMGQACGTCQGTYCMSNDDLCAASSLPYACVGTSTGMYCSDACGSDADCPAGMRCLASCPGHEDAAGICWKTGDFGFMQGTVCEAGAGSGSGTGEDPCETCTTGQCGSELAKCNASSACTSLAKCVSKCSTDSCVKSCSALYSSGIQKLLDLLECMDDHCKSACS